MARLLFNFLYFMNKEDFIEGCRIIFYEVINMLDLALMKDGIAISSINKEDAFSISQWIEREKNYLKESSSINSIEFDEFMKRFIEYYITDNEIFLKLQKEDEIIGVLKGRVEGKELIFWFFMLGYEYRGRGLGKEIINIIIEHFCNDKGIKSFSAAVSSGNEQALRFWKNNDFEAVRITKNFFEDVKDDKDLIIFKKML